jgi:predicted ATPase
VRIEASQLDRAAVLAAELSELAERHGFDFWQGHGATLQASVGALASLGADDVDPTTLAAHIATMTRLLDTLRTFGLLMYITFYDAVLARLLIAAGEPEQARHRLDTALQLAEDTGMHFYDAELRRQRAHTHTDPEERQADLAVALQLAHRQGAPLFELRATLDDFELRGQSARAALIDAASRFLANNAWPELARARIALESTDPQLG